MQPNHSIQDMQKLLKSLNTLNTEFRSFVRDVNKAAARYRIDNDLHQMSDAAQSIFDKYKSAIFNSPIHNRALNFPGESAHTDVINQTSVSMGTVAKWGKGNTPIGPTELRIFNNRFVKAAYAAMNTFKEYLQDEIDAAVEFQRYSKNAHDSVVRLIARAQLHRDKMRTAGMWQDSRLHAQLARDLKGLAKQMPKSLARARVMSAATAMEQLLSESPRHDGIPLERDERRRFGDMFSNIVGLLEDARKMLDKGA